MFTANTNVDRIVTDSVSRMISKRVGWLEESLVPIYIKVLKTLAQLK